MDKKKIKQLCNEIAIAADSIVSVGASATASNAPQLMGIQRAAALIAGEIDKPEAQEKQEEQEVAEDGR